MSSKWLLIHLFVVSVSSIRTYNDQIQRISAAGASQVGESCQLHTDCITGASCQRSVCHCLPTHIPLEKFCWKKISPGETGCTYDEQCDATWPNAKCSEGSCECPFPMKISRTREGPVCHIPGECPTNGPYSMLNNRNTDQTSQCYFFDGEHRAGKFIGCDDFPDLYECIDGICCPSRALTCIQSLDAGRANESHVSVDRWHYDADSRTCREFRFTGVGGNANNFITADHCEAYCSFRCPRGQPQLQGDGDTSQIVTCEASKEACEDGYECVSGLCCPSVELICSDQGGIISDRTAFDGEVPIISPFSLGSNRLGQPSIARWYWDSNDRTCKAFKYLGQGGNYNNFASEHGCLQFCAKALCKMGEPLRSSSGEVVSCTNSTGCPSSHECDEAICCPTAGTVCNQPKSEGVTCLSAPVDKYWFNAAKGLCQKFRHKGCHGNANKFSTLQECETHCAAIEAEPICPKGSALRVSDGKFWKCGSEPDGGSCPTPYECRFDGRRFGCCPTKQHVCSSPADEGTGCSPDQSLRWHWDSSSGECRSFAFGGCDGNANNFASLSDCREFCATADCPHGATPLRDNSGSLVTCSSTNACPTDYFCLPSLSNENVNVCCNSRKSICSQDMSEGTQCAPSISRYYFDVETSTCRSFSFLGCEGTSNNFPSKAACSHTCHSATCAASELIYQTSTGEVFDCSKKSCPKGYICVVDVWRPDRRVCCGAPSFGVCPSGQRAFLEHVSQQPLTCAPGLKHNCPAGFSCLFNSQRNNYFCCAQLITTVSCPDGARMARWLGTGDARGCNNDDSCGEDARCHAPDAFRTGVCCHEMDNVCPPTFTFDKELSERECSPLDRDSCSRSRQSVCLFSEKMKRFVCCRRSGRPVLTVDRCPTGSIQDEQKVFCSSEKSCPSSHFCVRRDADRIGICCRHPSIGRQKPTTSPAPIGKSTCPFGTSLEDIGTGTARLCNNRFPCPAPFMCTPSAEDPSIRVCCEGREHRTTCTNGTVPLNIDGLTYSCKTKNCPPGYLCEQSICCPSHNLACNEPMFIGTSCDDSDRSTLRYYYNSKDNICRSFDFRGCNPGANTFIDEKSCTVTCVDNIRELMPKEGLSCPKPLKNPKDWPQICDLQRPSCSAHEQCTTLKFGATVCCERPTEMQQRKKPSLQELMDAVCGAGLIPATNRNGDPVRCSRFRPCGWGASCLFSHLLLVDICCLHSPSPSPFEDHIDSRRIYRPGRLQPGEIGCKSSPDCGGQAVCVRGICSCRQQHVQFHRICRRFCPPHYRNIDGKCI